MLAVLGLAACKPSSTVSTTTGPSTHPPSPSASQAAAASSAPARLAHVGDTLTISDSGDRLAATLVRVAPVKATDSFSTPPAGDRFYGVQIRLRNTGTKTWSDAIDNDVTGQDAAGDTFQADIVESINVGTMFPTPVTIAPGSQSQGWVVLDVPRTARVAKVQLVLSSGFGNGAQWLVP